MRHCKIIKQTNTGKFVTLIFPSGLCPVLYAKNNAKKHKHISTYVCLSPANANRARITLLKTKKSFYLEVELVNRLCAISSLPEYSRLNCQGIDNFAEKYLRCFIFESSKIHFLFKQKNICCSFKSLYTGIRPTKSIYGEKNTLQLFVHTFWKINMSRKCCRRDWKIENADKGT